MSRLDVRVLLILCGVRLVTITTVFDFVDFFLLDLKTRKLVKLLARGNTTLSWV